MVRNTIHTNEIYLTSNLMPWIKFIERSKWREYFESGALFVLKFLKISISFSALSPFVGLLSKQRTVYMIYEYEIIRYAIKLGISPLHFVFIFFTLKNNANIYFQLSSLLSITEIKFPRWFPLLQFFSTNQNSSSSSNLCISHLNMVYYESSYANYNKNL